MTASNPTPTDDVIKVIDKLRNMLPGKVSAYGAAHLQQARIWPILLEDYRQPNGSYVLPASVVRDMPRLTRCLDRVCRITAAGGGGDPLGENPWLDLAGDAIAGMATVMRHEQAYDRLLTAQYSGSSSMDAQPCGGTGVENPE